jgi:hydroxymethylpyrimidine pyrophosphatase-like HAD family hydrolase
MKTIICDIDGTIFKYVGGMADVTNNPAEPLPGVIDQLNKWELKGCKIIIITGRRESMRKRTEEDLQRFGIPYDILLMGYADTGRVVINDEGSRIKAHAVSLKRDDGFINYNWEEVGLTNI